MRNSFFGSRWMVVAMLASGMAASGCKPSSQPGGEGDGKPAYSFITNGAVEFWNHAEAGCEKAAEDLGVSVSVQKPKDITEQTRMLEDAITRGSNGVAISPINPANQTETLNHVADAMPLVTHDSDAPESNRLVYIGMNNYDAGYMCGELVLKALPDGGEIMLFIGRLDQDNAQFRRQGCIDAILGREKDPSRRDPPSATPESEGGKYKILGTLTDNFDEVKAKANAEDALTRHPELDAMVGLFEYNPPMILEALDRSGKLGKVQVVAFDENDGTLQGIVDGHVIGTVVQDPYMYGYKSIEVLHALHQGKTDVIPEGKFIDVPARVIDKANVEPFWKTLRERLGKE